MKYKSRTDDLKYEEIIMKLSIVKEAQKVN